MMMIGSLSFAAWWMLPLLLLLPVWWLLRRRRRAPAIVFSRAHVLARGPRAGRAISRSLFILRNLLLAALVLALAGPGPAHGPRA